MSEFDWEDEDFAQLGQSVTVKLPPPKPYVAPDPKITGGRSFKAPPPKSAWERFLQTIEDFRSTAGEGVVSHVRRSDEKWNEETLINQTSPNPQADVAQNRERRVKSVKDERERRLIRDQADPIWADEDKNFLEKMGHVGATLAGEIVGDANPSYAATLGRGGPVARIVGAGAINALTDIAVQWNEKDEGIIEKMDPVRTIGSFAAGSALQGAGEAAVKGVRSAETAFRLRRGYNNPSFAELEKVMLSLEGGGTLDNPKTSPKGALGPYQVMPDTARKPGFGIRPWNGKSQEDLARVGRQYLAAMTEKYKGDHSKILAAYNAGPGRVDNALKQHGDNWLRHLPAETRDYVSNGLRKMGRLGQDGLPKANSVSPIDPEVMARIMDDGDVRELDELTLREEDRVEGLDRDAELLLEEADRVDDTDDWLEPEGPYDYLDYNDEFVLHELSRRKEADPDYILGDVEKQRIDEILANDPGQINNMVNFTFGGPDGRTMTFDPKAGGWVVNAAVHEFPVDKTSPAKGSREPADVVDINEEAGRRREAEDAKFDEDYVKQTESNYWDARRLADGVTAGRHTDDAVSAMVKIREGLKKDLDELDYPVPMQAKKNIEDTIKVLDDAIAASGTKPPRVDEIPDAAAKVVSPLLHDAPRNAANDQSKFDKYNDHFNPRNKTEFYGKVIESEIKAQKAAKALEQRGPFASREEFEKALAEELGNSGGGGDRVPPRDPPSGGEPPRDGGDGDGPEGPDGEEPIDPKYASSINLNRLEISDGAKNHLRELARDKDVPIQTHEETKAAAREMLDEHGVEGILSMETIAPADLPAYNTALRAINASAAERVHKLSKLILDDSKRTPILEYEMNDARMLAAAAFEKANGSAALAGRILEAQKIVVGNSFHGDMNKLLKEYFGNSLDSLDFARLVAAHDPKKANEIAADSLRAGWDDVFFTLWYNWKLSGLTTQVANISGSLINFLGENLAGAMTSAPGQTKARTYGILMGLKQAFSRTIAGADGKMRTPIGKAFELGTPLDLKPRVEMGRVFNFEGAKRPLNALEFPTRGLAAVDEFWRNIATVSKVYEEAWIKANGEGLEGDALSARVTELADNPTKDMTLKAVEWGRRVRFADEPSFVTRAVANVRHTNRKDPVSKSIAFFARAILPFTWTLDRLTATSVRWSPVSVMDRVTREDWKAGGQRRRQAIARTLIGTAIVASIVMANMEEGGVDFTGSGPKDYRKRQEKEAAGWREHSVAVDGDHYQVKQLQPLSTIFATVSSAMEAWKEDGSEKSYGDKIVKAIQATTGALLSGAWTESLSNYMETNQGRGGSSSVANWLGSFFDPTPNIVRQVNSAYIDRKVRDTTGDGSFEDRVLGRWMSGIPGLSDNLPQKSDVYGKKKVRDEALGPDAVSPIKVSKARKTAVINELQKLSGNKSTPLVGPPQRNVNDKYLDAKDYQKYTKRSGDIFMDMATEEILFSPDWNIQTKTEKKKRIKKMLSAARKQARAELFPTGETQGDWSLDELAIFQ